VEGVLARAAPARRLFRRFAAFWWMIPRLAALSIAETHRENSGLVPVEFSAAGCPSSFLMWDLMAERTPALWVRLRVLCRARLVADLMFAIKVMNGARGGI
jgi:hypothetical protein